MIHTIKSNSMESDFSKRFKSSMKINKNQSMFETLIPINKSIKLSQIHEDLPKVNSKLTSSLHYDIMPSKEPNDHFYFLPPIHSPVSTQSTNRIHKDLKKESVRFSYAGNEFISGSLSKNISPVSFRDKMQNDIKRIMRNIEKNELEIIDKISLNKRSKGLKRNKSKY